MGEGKIDGIITKKLWSNACKYTEPAAIVADGQNISDVLNEV